MKKIILILSCLSLVLCFSAPVLLVGCNTNQQQRALQSIKSVGLAVNSAIDIYKVRFADGKVSPANAAAVSAAFYRYHAAMGLAIDAVQHNANAPAPASLVDVAGQLLEILKPLIQ